MSESKVSDDKGSRKGERRKVGAQRQSNREPTRVSLMIIPGAVTARAPTGQPEEGKVQSAVAIDRNRTLTML